MSGKISIFVKLCLVVFVVSLFVGYTQWDPSIASGNRKTPIYKGTSKMIPMNTSSQPTVTSSLSSITQYDLRILLIVYNRAKSMLRLLNSINEAIFDGDNVKLEVWIDRSKLKLLKDLYSSTVIMSSEIAVILEDDLTVSPHFYKYLKLVHNKYDSIPEINGFALHGKSLKHGIGYSSQTLEGPEGCLLIATRQFSRTFPEMWLPSGLRFSRPRERQMGCGLTTNWMEAGLHFAKSANKPTNDLLMEWKSDYENLPDQPKHLDLKGVVQD
ncbi:hypothetical protein MAR_012771 [Mya arenaria]|uniref:Uncharacterized protein n=1 Tax=Mya arenaria TaxID=6604 RepID=A0ABY7FY07_MYAAR|nr:hypothetical protein MAR_012771 [Mya arenaria]